MNCVCSSGPVLASIAQALFFFLFFLYLLTREVLIYVLFRLWMCVSLIEVVCLMIRFDCGAGGWRFVALRLLTVWRHLHSLTLQITLQMRSVPSHHQRGFFPPAHAPPGYEEMDEDVRWDEDWLQVTLFHFKERWYFPYLFLPGWHTGVHLFPTWKISLIELPQSDSTITAEMSLWSGSHSIK